MMEDTLEVEGLGLTYPDAKHPALDGVTLRVAPGEVLALVGRSGGGKTSFLRVVAGLERPTRGAVRLGGATLSEGRVFVRPERRRIGLVAQGADLFPHLTIARNVAYGLRGRPRAERRARVGELLEQVGLAGCEERHPASLSGGEAQRVALARALAPRPRLLLLDEPFSSVDAELRERLRDLTAGLLRAARTTAVFVTHHGEDALAVGDRVAVLESGRLVQVGTPRELWERPADAGVASLFGPVNVIATVGGGDQLVRPEHLALCAPGPGGLLEGTVFRVEFLGRAQRVSVRPDGGGRAVRVDAPADAAVEIGSRTGVRRIG